MLGLRSQQALREGLRLLKEDEREREESKAKIAREQVLMSEELNRIVEETEVREPPEDHCRFCTWLSSLLLMASMLLIVPVLLLLFLVVVVVV